MTQSDFVLVRIKRLPSGQGVELPKKMSELAAGFDLSAAVLRPTHVRPGETALIPCGFALSLPPGYVGDIRPRSGLAIKHGISVANSPGTIDADYRGEIEVGLINLGNKLFTVERGQRIAQLVILALPTIRFLEVDELDVTGRNESGFGHTG